MSSKEYQAFRDEQEDIEDIHRTLEDAGVGMIDVDEALNIDMAEHEDIPPKRVSFKKGGDS